MSKPNSELITKRSELSRTMSFTEMDTNLEQLKLVINQSNDNLDIRLRQNLKRLAAEAGFNLVDGSFEEGANISGWPDVVWSQADGKYYQWHLDAAKTVAAGSSPTNIGTDWIDCSPNTLRSDINVIQKRFSTVAEMKSNLTAYDIGKSVEWLGYYDSTDGGGNSGVVVAAGTGTDDGGLYFTCTSGVQVKSSQDNNTIYLVKFGVKAGDSTFNNVERINAAYATGYPLIVWPSAILYWDGTPITTYSNQTTWAVGSTLKLMPGTYNTILTGITNRKAYAYNAALTQHYDITVFGLTVDGNKSNITMPNLDTATSNGYWWHQATRVKMIDCSAVNMPGNKGGQPGIMYKFCTDITTQNCKTSDTDRNGVAYYETTGKHIGGSFIKSRWREPILVSSDDVSDAVQFQNSNISILATYVDNRGSTYGKWGIRFSGHSEGYIGGGTKIYHQNTVINDEDLVSSVNTRALMISFYPELNNVKRLTIDGLEIYGSNTDVYLENAGESEINLNNIRSYGVQYSISANQGSGATKGVLNITDYLCVLTGVCNSIALKNIEFVNMNRIRIENQKTSITLNDYGNFTMRDITVQSATVATAVITAVNRKSGYGGLPTIDGYTGISNNSNNIRVDGSAYIARGTRNASFTGTGVACEQFGNGENYLFFDFSSPKKLFMKTGSAPTSSSDGTQIT